MAMSTELTAAAALASINGVLLLGLGAIWVRNYRTFRTPMVLGLVAFAAVLLVQNLAALYFFFSMDVLYAMNPGAHTFVVVLRGLETLALLILGYVTWR
ncbi:MAG: hypothetical protein V5A43_09440 [Haloarculaceae archaeon]